MASLNLFLFFSQAVVLLLLAWLCLEEQTILTKDGLKEWSLRIFTVFFLFAPFNFNGNIITILGSAENQNGSIYSVASLFQNGRNTWSVFFSGYQHATGNATVIFGVSGYQEAENAYVGVGVSGYQHATDDAAVFIGFSGYQYAGSALFGVGISGYQHATADKALVLVGFSGYQYARHLTALGIGVSLYQHSEVDMVEYGLSGYQYAEHVAHVNFGVSVYQNSGFDAVLLMGLSGYQYAVKGRAAVAIFGLAICQKEMNRMNREEWLVFPTSEFSMPNIIFGKNFN